MNTKTLDLAAEFWDALDIQQKWMNPPTLVQKVPQPIWKMTAKKGYLFDDAFWEVFQQFPFKICHVSYSGAPWSLEGGPPEMVIRFTVFDWVLKGAPIPPWKPGDPIVTPEAEAYWDKFFAALRWAGRG